MAERPVAGKGCLPRLALILLFTLLTGCAGQPSTPNGSPDAAAGIAGSWVSIRRGDTLGNIANRAEVPLVRLQRFNPGIEPRGLAVGQRVLVPNRQERAPSGGPYRYQIRPGDTFTSVARRFGADPSRVVAANPDVTPTDLKVGHLIQVPLGGGSSASSSSASTPPARLPDPGTMPADAKGWPWPLDDYDVARRFGKDAHGTLQPMLLTTSQGARAKAVADGQVRFADSMRQLGQVVIVHHPDNLQSVYARCARLLVDSGQRVERGTPLCVVGTASNGRHELLFDMRHGGKPMDPQTVLR
ncbi:peptidoglycan DD-metalloendopeptidase family protein [Halomonas eurihalina]|uniref:Peptidoglycan DD-metalloendopeptidase family protein n=1 Tax=Halomonas eurihalina TaxID=42566 RepID=A0A5D9DDU1_HALER|nr:peptidoglycan DD-metalloendopeptidase family protein [Halomonas eurihalina]MDR5858640.1 peptidoglycan DD-metalloendopeptidase family protein [Halomonas eurihalina]TZG40825.1 peptidoglycan DD-metalloendopeptidase family protein [Halomonas eurihalina]